MCAYLSFLGSGVDRRYDHGRTGFGGGEEKNLVIKPGSCLVQAMCKQHY